MIILTVNTIIYDILRHYLKNAFILMMTLYLHLISLHASFQVRLNVLNVVEVLVSIREGTVDDGSTVDLEITLVGDEQYLCSHY